MAPGTNLAVWGDYDDEAAQEDEKAYAKQNKFFKIKGNKAQIRILPPKAPLKNPYIKTFRHYVEFVPDDKSTAASFNCPYRMAKKPCPFCEQAAKLRAEKRDERAKVFAAKPRIYAAIIDRSDMEAGVQVYAFGKQIFEQLIDEREEHKDYLHPLKGRDIVIRKKGEKRDTQWKVRCVQNPSPILTDVTELNELAEQVPDMLEYAVIPTVDEIREIIQKARDGNTGGDGASNVSGGGDGRQPARQGRNDDFSGGGDDGWGDDDGFGGGDSLDTEGETIADTAGSFGDDDDDDIPF